MAINFKTKKNMATIKNGFLDAFEGKLGPAVGYRWKGRPCVRSYQPYPHDPCTPAQLAQRRRFHALSQLASAMLPAVKLGFRGPATEGRTTAYNCFLKDNKQYVSIVDDEVSIDYSALNVSDGPLPTVDFGQPQVDEGLTVSVSYADHSGRPGDYVLLYAFTPSLGQGRLAPPVYRYQGLIVSTLPAHWTGNAVHLYGFCWDRDLSASPSVHIGQIDL